MITRNDIKYIQSLQAAGERAQHRQFIAEGTHLAEEAIRTIPERIAACYATAAWLQQHTVPAGINITEVSVPEMSRLSALKTPQGIVLVVQYPTGPPQPLPLGKWLLALDGIQDPGNAGTLVRLADWFGLGGMLCGNGSADVFGPKAVQASMGSIFRVPIWSGALPELLQHYTGPVYGALLKGTPVWEVTPAVPGCLIIGSEGRGISDEVLTLVTQPITIPKQGAAESLNAAVAGGILVSHLCRAT